MSNTDSLNKKSIGLNISSTTKAFDDYKVIGEVKSLNMSSDKETVFYKICLKSNITNEEWEVNRRYSDFYEYYTLLTANFYNVPNLPRKTLTKVTTLPELETRKEQLNSFIRVSKVKS